MSLSKDRKRVVDLVLAERAHQDELGFTERDFQYTRDELVLAAVTYATPARFRKLVWRGDGSQTPTTWPWHSDEFKPTPDDRRREIVIAAALLLAELERAELVGFPEPE